MKACSRQALSASRSAVGGSSTWASALPWVWTERFYSRLRAASGETTGASFEQLLQDPSDASADLSEAQDAALAPVQHFSTSFTSFSVLPSSHVLALKTFVDLKCYRLRHNAMLLLGRKGLTSATDLCDLRVETT